MLLRQLLCATSCALSFTLFSQMKTDQAEVAWGDVLNTKKDGAFTDLIADTPEGVYQLVSLKGDPHVRKMGHDLSTKYLKPLDLEHDKKELKLEQMSLVGNKLVQFASLFDKKNEETVLYMKTYEAADMRSAGRVQRIAKVQAERKKNAGGYNIHVSPDGKRVLVEVEKPHTKNGAEELAVLVFDQDMNELWSQEISLPYQDSEFMREKLHVDNDGSVIVLGVKYTKKAERRERKRADEATYDYHVLIYRAGGGAPEDLTISSPARFLQDMTISLDNKNGNIICAGFYSDVNTQGIKGPYFLSFDRASKRIVHESYGEFDREFITLYMTEKEEKKESKKAEKKDKDLGIRWDYDLRDIVFKDDGGAVLVAEQYYWYTTTTCTPTANGGQTCTTTWHYIYNDIIAVDVDAKGDIQWSAKVPKRQHSMNDGGLFSSYALEVHGDKLHFIFNDNGENLFLKPGDKIKQFKLNNKNSLVTIATVDRAGQVQREALFTPEKREAILRPKDCVQMEDDRMLIYATFKKEARYGFITFK